MTSGHEPEDEATGQFRSPESVSWGPYPEDEPTVQVPRPREVSWGGPPEDERTAEFTRPDVPPRPPPPPEPVPPPEPDLWAADEPEDEPDEAFVPQLGQSAREEILERVRIAVGGRPLPDEDIPRAYRRSFDRSRDEVVALFVERASDYRASVRRIAHPQLAAEIAVRLVERGIQSLAAPPDLPATWLPAYVDVLVDAGHLDPRELAGVDGVLTASAVAIAETGTVVLDGGSRQGRRVLSLVPDYHLCVVDATSIVGNLPEALRRLDPERPLTFVSGPSATSDIELDRVEGVHGPRVLDILVAE